MNSTSIRQAAEKSGLSVSTISNYMREPEFKTEYDRLCADVVADATNTARGAMLPALNTLKEILEKETTTDQIKIVAAQTILKYGIKLIETYDIISRIEKLEKIDNERIND